MDDENVQPDFMRKLKQNRRSSILKTTKPFDELQNVSNKDERFQRERRVSFANTIKIKEFLPNKGDEKDHKVKVADSPPGIGTVKMPKSAIQISTPLRTQCRRISTNPGLRIERFSLIPKLDQSSSLFEFEDFQIYQEESQTSITACGESSHIAIGNTSREVNGVEDVNSQAVQLQVSKEEICDMELTGCDKLAHNSSHESFSLCSPESLLKPIVSNGDVLDDTTKKLTFSCKSGADDDPTIATTYTGAGIFSDNICIAMDTTRGEDALRSISNAHLATSATQLDEHGNDHVFTSKHDCAMGPSVLCMEHTNTCDLVCTKSKQEPLASIGDRVDKTPFKKQTPSKPMLLLTSPYLKPFAGDRRDESSTAKYMPVNHSKLLESFQKADLFCCDSKTCKQFTELTDVPSQACSWLQDANSSSHLLDPSPVSKLQHTDFVHDSRQKSSIILSSQSSVSKFFPVSLSDSPLESVPKSANDLTLLINSPEVDTIKVAELSSHNNSGHNFHFVKDVTSCYESGSSRQSLIASPSVLSKFLKKLQCDRSMLCIEEDFHIVSEDIRQNSSQQVDLISLSLSHASISNPNEECVDIFNETNTLPHTSGTFSTLLDILRGRILRIVTSLQMRLSNKDYVQAHYRILPCLQRLISASNRCICVVDVLAKFGQLSGLSNTQCDWSILKSMTSIEISSSDLLGDRLMKAKWIQNMHHHIQLVVYPTVESVLHRAACIYPWHITKWSETRMEISCHHHCVLTLELLEDHRDGSIGVNNVQVVSVEGSCINEEGISCSSIDDIPLMLHNMTM